MKTKSMMKLSQQLIEHAEWWLTPGYQSIDHETYHNEAFDHLTNTGGLNFYSLPTLEDRANLILLEAEYQKDIEEEMEEHRIAHSKDVQLAVHYGITTKET